MGKKSKCFGAVKKVFSPESKDKKNNEKTHKSKKKWEFGKSNPEDPCSSTVEACEPPVAAPPPPIPAEEVKLTEVEHEQNKHAYSVALATAVAAEAATAAAQAAAEVVRLTTATTKFSGESREEIAAIKIQTSFRGYLARRALRALRGLVRLKSLVHGNAVRRQSATTLRSMQTLARVQSEIRSRRIRMTEENQALQRQLQLKHERELEALRASMGEEWDDSLRSKEKVEASILSKHEAAIRRERALAYAFSHQWKTSSRSMNPMFTDPNNPHWGWSWMERWMAARPWESRSMAEKDLNGDRASVKCASRSSVGGEITKAYARRDINGDRPSPVAQKLSRPASRQSPSTPPSKAPSVAGRIKPASPRGGWGGPLEDDSRSLGSMQSERNNRRHSIAGSSVRDDESLASSPTFPSYMAPTESARAKSRFHSPSSDKFESPDKGSTGYVVKKRLSFTTGDKYSSPSPAGARRHSGPPKVDLSSVEDHGADSSEQNASNGVSR